jgi:hypothetical protein
VRGTRQICGRSSPAGVELLRAGDGGGEAEKGPRRRRQAGGGPERLGWGMRFLSRGGSR